MKSAFWFLNKNGFTLAEILITLGIIGVVAALTIPTLISNFQDQEYKIAYKKAFSLASQAWTSAVSDYRVDSRTSWTDKESRINNFMTFKSYFKVIKDCDSNNNAECWDSSGEKYYTNAPMASGSAFIDSSGMAWSITSNGDGQGQEILVDTNGMKKPNKYGQDRFLFIPQTIDGGAVGLPIKIIPSKSDYTSEDSNVCPSGDVHPCYYQSWLYN